MMEIREVRIIIYFKIVQNETDGGFMSEKNRKTTVLGLVAFLAVTMMVDGLDVQRDIIGRARNYTGSAYCHGGIDPPCFDCSGFVLRIYRDVVPGMPRVSRDMARFGNPISRDDLQPGDLVFFATGGRADIVTHVAIYMGQDSIIHAISNGPNRGVTITPLSARYWESRYFSASRVLPRIEQIAEVSPDEAIEFSRGTYTGELRNGEPHGNGAMVMNNGDRYEGEFRNGLFHGDGVYRWSNGDRYEGTFRDGEMHGEGTFITAGGQISTGSWVAGERVQERAQDPDRPGEEVARQVVSRPTYIRSQDSPWDTWDGIVDGDFRAWQEEQDRAFEEFRRRSEPPRSR